jgi:aminobenzoyl-glutamate transport protein
MTAATDESRGFGRVLDAVERVGNALPDPVTLFALLAVAVAVVSWLASALGVAAVHPGTGETITAVNLLSAEGVRRMLTEAVDNFTAFPPLGLVIVVIIGIGVTEHSGLISAALRTLLEAVPDGLLTATLVFAGIMSNIAVDAGYVVVVPLGAVLFAAAGRHPLAGLAAAFAGVSAGFSANLLITSLDPLLSGLSQEGAQLVDPDYVVQPTANYYFMLVSTVALTALGAWVTARFVEPRLGEWDPSRGEDVEDAMHVEEVTARERKGLRVAALATVAVAVGMAVLVVPPGAPLRDAAAVAAGAPWYVQIRPFLDAIVTLLMLAFLLVGLAYGVVAGTIESDRDVARMSSEAVAVLGSYIVLAFAAAQFVAWFGWSNLGLILAIRGAELLQGIGFTGLPMILAFVVVAAGINLFIGSASAKWAVMAPVFVPMLMLTGYSPEMVQAAYRVGDSTTNIITPLMPYFPVIIAFAQRWDRESGLGTLISAMLPYSVVFLLGWLVMFAVWILLDLPLGPGAPLDYAGGVLGG